MEARIISTGEIVEVIDYNDSKVTVYRNDKTEFFAQNEYNRDDVEFFPETSDEMSFKGWICRDKDSVLTLFYGCDKPKKEKGDDYWSVTFGNDVYLPSTLYPEVTWESEPKKVKITISPI